MNAAVFVRNQAENEGKGKSEKPKGYDYSKVVLRPFQGIFWLKDIIDVKDEEYGDAKYGWMKVEYRFIYLVPGAEKATTKEEQDKFRSMGHGKMLSVKTNPICTAPFTKDDGEGGKASGMYNLHRILLAQPQTMEDEMVLDELTPEQMGEEPEDEIKAWVARYNKAVEAGDEATMAEMSELTPKDFSEAAELLAVKLTKETGKKRYAAAVLARTIKALEAEHPQVYATPATKTSKKTGNKYNILSVAGVAGRVPADAEIKGGYQPYERPTDPREEGDDPNLTCAICGKHTRGYERRVDQKWVSNRDAAKTSIEKKGEVRCAACYSKPAKTVE
jgi:hypothetical protein